MLPHIRARNLFLKNFKILGGVRRVRDMKMWSKNTEKFTQNAEREKQKKLIFLPYRCSIFESTRGPLDWLYWCRAALLISL